MRDTCPYINLYCDKQKHCDFCEVELSIKKELNYKGFTSAIHYSYDDKCFHGYLMGTSDLVIFESDTVDGIKPAFIDSVNDYIKLMEEIKNKEKTWERTII